MADKIYVVTLKKKDDLDGFYSAMESDGFKLQLKRPISRNTHYYMTDDEAATLRNDRRELAVELRPEDIPYLEIISYGTIDVGAINNAPYPHTGDFRKSGTFDAGNKDWGKLHVAGNDAQRRKGAWSGGTVNDNVDVFNDGRHVDVVVCDDPVSFDCEEWKALSDNRDRFQMYEWYNELNQYVSSIDDDGSGIFGVNMGDSTNSNYCVLTGYSQQQRTNPNRVLFIRRDSIGNGAFDVEINIGHGGTADVDFYFVNVMADT